MDVGFSATNPRLAKESARACLGSDSNELDEVRPQGEWRNQLASATEALRQNADELAIAPDLYRQPRVSLHRSPAVSEPPLHGERTPSRRWVQPTYEPRDEGRVVGADAPPNEAEHSAY